MTDKPLPKNKLYAHVLIDGSGSMLGNRSVTVRAYNEYVDSLEGDAVVSLSVFAGSRPSKDHIKVIHSKVTKANAKLDPAKYECMGGTPLLDAIGNAIQTIETSAADFDRIVLVIQTDGAENESTEFTLEQVKRLLEDKQQGEGWLVIFLGAGLDAFAQASALGIRRNTSLNYGMANSLGTMQSAGRATQSYASSVSRNQGVAEAAFTDDERKKSK